MLSKLCGLPAGSSEQLVQVSKPSSMGMAAAVPGEGVPPGSGTGLCQQLVAAVEPAVEPAVYSPRQHPFSRARTAPAPTGPMLRVDGVLIQPTTMVPPLNMPFVLAATSCISHLVNVAVCTHHMTRSCALRATSRGFV